MEGDKPLEPRRARVRNTFSPKNFGHYQLEYAHWLHMNRHRVANRHSIAKRRRSVGKNSKAGLEQKRPIQSGLAHRRPMAVGLAQRRSFTMRPTKFRRLDSSDRPAIKSAGLAVSQAPVNLLQFPRKVVDVNAVDAAVSASGDHSVSDGVHAAIQVHFGAMARIKAGAKCRIMARRWTNDDHLEYLVQWDAGIVA